MQRDRADRGLADATQRAAEEIAGLVADGPVKLVNDEIATLAKQAQDAEQRAERWTKIAQHLDAQTARHQAEDAETKAALQAAHEQANRICANVRAPILATAEADGRDYDDAITHETDTAEQLRAASLFGKSKARRSHRAAIERTEQVQERLRDRWGSTPTWSEPAEIWAARVADRAAEDTVEVAEATLALRSAEQQQKEMSSHHEAERRALLGKLYGAEQVRRDPIRYRFARPRREAQEWARIAEEASAEIAALRALPPEQAAIQIEVKRAVAEAAREAQEQEHTARKEKMLGNFKAQRNDTERSRPTLHL